MSARMRLLAAAGLAAALSLPAAAQDQWVKGFPGDKDLEIGQIFKIKTSGPMGREPSIKIQEEGTAFAISDNMLITARHVTRNADDFSNLAAGGKIHIPDRTVTYNFARDKDAFQPGDPFRVASVTPAATPTIDAARLNLGKSRAKPFKVSVCDIEEDEEYYLLKFRDGKMDVPRIVPIIADVEAYTDHGEARQFTHSEVGLNTPKEGDSGSPILNRSGHVIGLLTAIKDNDKVLFVTLARSFVELIPSSVDVECANRASKRDVNKVDTAFTAFVEQSQAEMEEMRAAFEQRVLSVETELTTKTDTMQEAIKQLISENKDLRSRLSRATLAANATIRVLNKIEAEGGLSDLEPAIYQEIIDNLKGQEPVIPQVQQMFPQVQQMFPQVQQMLEDLGVERWRFSASPQDFGQALQVTAEYERDISSPRYAEILQFCLRPLQRAETEDQQDDLDKADDIFNAIFYRETDKLPNGVNGMSCRFSQHPAAPPVPRVDETAKSQQELAELQKIEAAKTDEQRAEEAALKAALYPFKSGSYIFRLDSTVPANEEAPVFTGFYYGIMFKDTADPNERDITHRFMFETDLDNPNSIPKCYVFENDNGSADNMALFMKSNKEEREAIQKCSES